MVLWCRYVAFQTKTKLVGRTFNVPQFYYSGCFCLRVGGRRPLPAALATTSDIARLQESFQATPSQTARAQLERAATPPTSALWHIQQQLSSLGISMLHSNDRNVRRSVWECFGVHFKCSFRSKTATLKTFCNTGQWCRKTLEMHDAKQMGQSSKELQAKKDKRNKNKRENVFQLPTGEKRRKQKKAMPYLEDSSLSFSSGASYWAWYCLAFSSPSFRKLM